MQWRVTVELAGANGGVQTHEVHVGNCPSIACSAETLGLTLAEAKQVLAELQRHLVQAQTEEHCQSRRRCPRCGAQRPLKDRRHRRLRSLFGVVEVRAPRFAPCRCSMTLHEVLSPVAEIMPDRCTPAYERLLAEMGALLPYRRGRALLEKLLPLGEPPVLETVRQRTLQVGARLECQAAAPPRSTPAAEAKSITLSIDGGHVQSIRSYQVRSFEVFIAQASNDDGKRVVFTSVPAEAYHQVQQLRGVLHDLGATAATPVTILSDGAGAPRALGETASAGPTRHVLDCWGGRALLRAQSCHSTMDDRNATLPGQSDWLVNYAERHRAGLRVGTALTEGTLTESTTQGTRGIGALRAPAVANLGPVHPSQTYRYRSICAEAKIERGHIADRLLFPNRLIKTGVFLPMRGKITCL